MEASLELMMLRYLLSNWFRQTMHQQIRQTFSDPAQPAGAEGEEEWQAPPPAEVVCVFALGAESGGVVDLLTQCVSSRCASFVEYAGFLANRRVAVVESGVGAQPAAHATADAIDLHRPAWVISAGFAGSLHEDLRLGHILMATEVIDIHGSQLKTGLNLDPETVRATPGLHSGRLLTVDQLIRTTAEKRQLAAAHGAVACDMETLAVADVCRDKKVKFLSVRIISDALDDELPREIERLLDQKSLASKLGAATAAALNRPSSIKDMWKLKEQAIKASDRLARFVSSTIAQLPPREPHDS